MNENAPTEANSQWLQNLARTIASLSTLVLVSRILGITRDILIIKIFGFSGYGIAFLAAFRLPNGLRKLCSEAVFSYAFVPRFMEFSQARGSAVALKMAYAFLYMLAPCMVLVLGLCFLGAESIIDVLMPGAIGVRELEFIRTSSIQYFKLLLPYCFFLIISAYFSALLHSAKRLVVASLWSFFYSVSVVYMLFYVYTKVVYLEVAPYSICKGLLACAMVQSIGLVITHAVIAKGWSLKALVPNKEAWQNAVAALKGTPLPFFASSIVICLFLISSSLASFVGLENITVFYLAERLLDFPIGIIGVGCGLAALPELIQQGASVEEITEKSTFIARLVLFLAVPAGLGLSVIAPVLVPMLFSEETMQVEGIPYVIFIVQVLALSVPAFCLVRFLMALLLALLDVRNAVLSSLASLALLFLLSLFSLKQFSLGTLGLCVVLIFVAYFYAVLLHKSIKKKGVVIPGLVKAGFYFLGMSGLACVPAYLCVTFIVNPWLAISLAIVSASVLYMGLAFLLKVPEIVLFQKLLAKTERKI